MAESVSIEVIRRLGVYLKASVTDLCQVLEDWPESNMDLKYPSLTIFSGATPKLTPCAPWQLSDVAADGNNQAVNKYVIGQYDFSLQLDLWCSSKVSRHKLYEKMVLAFSGPFIDGTSDTTGIGLNLTDYHNIMCRYDLTGYKFDDSEAGSQRKEWRVKLDVLANCRAVVERQQYIIIETELLDTDINTEIVI